MTEKKTHFGFQEIPISEKTGRVAEVFDSVATRYDHMNDLMSGGLHRLWKRYAIELLSVKSHEKILDLAAGTADLSRLIAKNLSDKGLLVTSDINANMLSIGRDRLMDAGHLKPIHYAQINAEQLPFQPDTFDAITIGFGLRNVTLQTAALAEMYRVLKPGGRLLVLEFSRVKSPLLKSLYDTYSFKVLPMLGKLVANDSDSYQYLAESIRKHPDQDTLKSMMQAVGFCQCRVTNLLGGIVAIHRGWKIP